MRIPSSIARVPVAAAALALALGSTPAFAAEPITGNWITQDGKAVVAIAPCGQALCGRIARILAPTSGPTVDENNPNPKLRSRPIQGMTVLTGFTEAGDEWKGQIYDPEKGKTYKSVLRRNGQTLKVKGCVLFICQSQTWKRAS